MNSEQRKLLTVKDLAIKLNVREGHIRQLVFRKAIPYLKVGQLVRFLPEQIDNWMKENSSH